MPETKKPYTYADREYNRRARLLNAFKDLFMRAKAYGYSSGKLLEERGKIYQSPDWGRSPAQTHEYLSGYFDCWWDSLYSRGDLVFLQMIDSKWLNPEQVNEFFRSSTRRSYSEITHSGHFWGGDSTKPF